MKRTAFSALALILALCVPLIAQTPESRWVNFEGSKIHFQEAGNKKKKNAIVFVHGWMCSTDFWSDSINAFPNQRVIAIDLIGHGKSDKPKLPYTIDLFARSIAAVLNEAKVNRAVLVGHSMGAPIVHQFYHLYPGRVRGLVIVDGSLRPYFTAEEGDQFLKTFRADYSAASSDFVNGMLRPISNDALKNKIAGVMLSGPSHVGISAMEGLSDEKGFKPDRIKVPVLAIFDGSGGWPADNESYLRSLAPKLDYKLWTGVSHFLMMERPSEFNAQLKMFMMRNKIL